MSEPQGENFLIPNALWGSFAFAAKDSGFGYDRKRLRARSTSFSDALGRRFIAACQVWGEPPTGFERTGAFFQVPTLSPAYLSQPGQTGHLLQPGVLAVAARPMGQDHARREGALGFHCLFLTEDTFASMDDQCFGLWRAQVFLNGWDGKDELALAQIERTAARAPTFENVRPESAEALTRELAHILKGGDVVYKIARPDTASDEHLRLLQLGLPRALRIDLGFASFLGHKGLNKQDTVRKQDSFAICAVPGPSAFQPGRCQLVATRRPPAGSEAAIAEYAGSYRDCIAGGDLPNLLKLSRTGLPEDPPGGTESATRGGGFFSWLRK